MLLRRHLQPDIPVDQLGLEPTHRRATSNDSGNELIVASEPKLETIIETKG